ncbi:pyruvate dehydrogenase E2 component (dihydrolipoamide acetyltransferase) [Microbacterium sp. ru370.1]|uniref:dihydrolipoamide acetyltransferase family protein n=1 Tax=unclassified Microbacterium TaxID=2609290 RepID=UPI00088713BA|nr:MULTISPECIES: dihydrolipoamide acetyltransferase family protein [unclassified Microbacterium]SDO73617.1 pyruvate dehydrogenase E2 component (dihydrolipoamide acetyltransferase) [Microbacterium sp. ru370.1]SIT87876.1 pyruvate dehydrogenase E2 component (dihydrolipoamide acetyltransferase) [Microbacterium sp. RU1D]
MIEEFLLPDLGEGLPEAEIVAWLVAEGDVVRLNQTIAEVETAKAVVEIPSPYAGTVQGLHAAAGDVVAVGSPLVSFAVGGAEAKDPAPERAAGAGVTGVGAAGAGVTGSGAAGVGAGAPGAVAAGATADEAERATPNLVGYGAAPSTGSRPTRRARGGGSTATLDADTAVREAAPHDVVRTGPIDLPLERPRSTPPVRKLAKDLGVDLVLVAAAHPGEAVTRAHVEEYAAREPAASVAPSTPASRVPPAASASVARPAPGERVTRTPIRGVRKHTAAAMVQSAFTAPHATTFLTLDVTATTELLASLKTDRALDGHRIGVLAVVAKAVCLALGRTPALNARWDEAAGEIIEHHYVNLGIAAATDRGLVVPVVRDAERLALVDLADAIAELAGTARAGRTAPADMTGGTFSITNVGVFGVDAGTPILNPGEAGILAVGAVRRTPWEHRGEIALRDVLTLSLSFDHRVVDGAEAARFLTDVAGVLREPGRAMLLR